jgi:L-ascorbate metabolism protein UlaG (beta-lactamase superfamily)
VAAVSNLFQGFDLMPVELPYALAAQSPPQGFRERLFQRSELGFAGRECGVVGDPGGFPSGVKKSVEKTLHGRSNFHPVGVDKFPAPLIPNREANGGRFDEDPTKEATMNLEDAVKKIHWLGHDSFRIDGSKVVYFDPYQIAGGPPADLILISHEHFDHCSPEDVAKISADHTVIVTDAASAGKLKGDVRVVKPGDRLEVEGVGIEVYPAYNVDKQFHPKSAGMLSFVVTLDGVRYYHAGDTDVIPEMKDVKADVAFLPVSGTYVMTAQEAAEAARAVRPKIAIPMHYGAIVGSADDAEAFRKALEGEIKVLVLPKE